MQHRCAVGMLRRPSLMWYHKFIAQTFKTIQKKLQPKFSVLAREYHVKRLGVFGSAARGRDTAKSDVDMLVSFSRLPGLFGFIRLEDYLSNLLNRKVDLATKNAIKPIIRERVLREVMYV